VVQFATAHFCFGEEMGKEMSNETLTDLLPCPFCGSTKVAVNGGRTQSWVDCTDCDGAGPPTSTRELAITLWNGDRAASASRSAAALRSVLSELIRLYDWRKKLAEEEDEIGMMPSAETTERQIRRAALDKKLRQYGREKAAAWARAKEVMR